MRPRKSKDLKRVLQTKGFLLDPAVDHHETYVLMVEGKKHSIHTYFSHGLKEYGATLMGKMKKQLKFADSAMAEDFFDCPLTAEGYLEALRESGNL